MSCCRKSKTFEKPGVSSKFKRACRGFAKVRFLEEMATKDGSLDAMRQAINQVGFKETRKLEVLRDCKRALTRARAGLNPFVTPPGGCPGCLKDNRAHWLLCPKRQKTKQLEKDLIATVRKILSRERAAAQEKEMNEPVSENPVPWLPRAPPPDDDDDVEIIGVTPPPPPDDDDDDEIFDLTKTTTTMPEPRDLSPSDVGFGSIVETLFEDSVHDRSGRVTDAVSAARKKLTRSEGSLPRLFPASVKRAARDPG